MALEASRAEVSPKRTPVISQRPAEKAKANAPSKSEEPVNVPAPPPYSEQVPSFLNERAKMEKERLERQAKRLREKETSGSVGQSLEEPPAKRPRPSASSSEEPRKVSTAEKIRQAEASANELAARMNFASGASTSSSSINTMFWDGELRQTANRLVDKEKDKKPTFRISEIIGKVRVCFCLRPMANHVR